MAGAGAAVLLMPPGRVDGELEQLLGDDRARELRAVLSDAAEEWALQVACSGRCCSSLDASTSSALSTTSAPGAMSCSVL
jgi:hypothetical protein